MKIQETSLRYFGIQEGTFTDNALAIDKLMKTMRVSLDFFENYGIQEMLGDDIPFQSDLFRFNFSGYLLDKSSLSLEQIMESPTANMLSSLPLTRQLIERGDLEVQTNKEVVDFIKNGCVPSIEDLLKTDRQARQTVNYLCPFEVRNAANFMSDAYLENSLKKDQLRNKIETIKARFKKKNI